MHLDWVEGSVGLVCCLMFLFDGICRWSAVPEEEWPEEEAQRAVILSDFQADVGDRRQELVFIGVGMNEVRDGSRSRYCPSRHIVWVRSFKQNFTSVLLGA